MADIATLTMKVDSTDIVKAESNLTKLEKQSGKTEKATTRLEREMKGLGATAKLGLAVGFTAVAAAGAKSLMVFTDIERGLIGVQKTTDFTKREMSEFEHEIGKMSRTIPVATRSLIGISEAAGQLGIKGVDNVTKFTKTMAQLELATDVVGEEGAKSIARLLNVTGDGIETVDKFGSVLVALGNNSAATESEILKLGTEIAMATSTFAVSSTETIALGAAMKSMGIRAELAGSVTGRAMRAIESSIEAGGEKMEHLSKVTGIATDDLKRQFGENTTQVFTKWLEGVGEMVKGGTTAASALEMFGLKGEEVMKVLPTMAVNIDQVKDSLKLESDELEKNTALENEAAKATEGLGSQMQFVRNIVGEVATKIGKNLAPMTKDIIKEFREWYDLNGEFLAQDVAGWIGDVATETSNTIKSIGEFKDEFDGLLKLNSALSGPTWEWGIIGMLLFKGKPGLAAMLGTLTVLNNSLAHFDLNIGNLVDSAKGFGESMNKVFDGLIGKRDFWTGEVFGEEIRGNIEEFNTVLNSGNINMGGLGSTTEETNKELVKAGKMMREMAGEIEPIRRKESTKTKKSITKDLEETLDAHEDVNDDRLKDEEKLAKALEEVNKRVLEKIEKERETSLLYAEKLNVHYAKQITDVWEIQARDREDIDRRTNDYAERDLKETYNNIDRALEDFYRDYDEMSVDSIDFVGQLWVELFTGIEKEGEKTYGALSKQFGDWAGDLVDNKFDSIGDAWDALWKGMLRTVVDTVATMAAQFVVDSVVSAFFHEGTWGEDDEILAVVKKGEIVVPEEQSERIRRSVRGGSIPMEHRSSDFDILAYAVEQYGNQDRAGDMSNFGIGAGELEGFGGYSIADTKNEIDSVLGESGASVAGGMIGGVAGYGLAGMSPVGGVPGVKGIGRSIGTEIGSRIGDMFGDMTNSRSYESLREMAAEGHFTAMELQGRKTGLDLKSGKGWSVTGIDAAVEKTTNMAKDFVQQALDHVSEMFGIDQDTSTGRGGVHGGGPGADLGAAPGGDRQDSGGYDFGNSGRTEGDSGGADAGGDGGGGHGERGGGNEGDSSPGGIGGYSKGGVVDRLIVPQGDDGWAPMKFNEGVIPEDTMKILASQIRSGNFGGNSDELVQILIQILQVVRVSEQNSFKIFQKIEGWDYQGMPPERSTI